MAFASSRIGTQEALITPCDLCDDDEDVNWFCKDCVKKLCERCKKTHLKIVICRNHQIVSILEGVAIQKINVSNICLEHNELFSFFCQTCEENICSKCLSIIHKKHDFTDIHSLHSELQSRLDKIMREKQDEKMEMTKNIDELEKYANQCRDSLTLKCVTIDDRVKAIKASVNEEGNNLKENLRNATDKQLAEGDMRRQKLERRKHDYDETIKTIQQDLILQTTSTLNDFVNTSTFKLQSLKPMACSIPVSRDTLMVDGSINKDILREMICKNKDQLSKSGSPAHVKQRKINISSKLEIVTIHELTEQNDFFSMCTNHDGSIWIGGDANVYKMDSSCSTVLLHIPLRRRSRIRRSPLISDVILSSLRPPMACDYTACLMTGDAIVSWRLNERFLVKLTSDGRCVRFTDIFPMFTHLTSVKRCYNDEVVVSLVDEGWFSSASSLILFSKGEN